jgi:hypothetical protein
MTEMEEANRHKLGVLYGAIVFLMLFILVVNTPSTSLPKRPNFHSQLTGFVIGSNQDIALSSNDPNDPLTLSSLRLSGEIYGAGDVTVKLKEDAPGWHREYLVFSNKKMVLKKTDSLSGITMLAVYEPSEMKLEIISPVSGVTRGDVMPVKVYFLTPAGNVNRIELFVKDAVYAVQFPEETEGYVTFDVDTKKYFNGEYEVYAKMYVETLVQQLGSYPFPTITIKNSDSKKIIFYNDGREAPAEESGDEGIGVIPIIDNAGQGGAWWEIKPTARLAEAEGRLLQGRLPEQLLRPRQVKNHLPLLWSFRLQENLL